MIAPRRVWFDEVASTNDEALRLAKEGAPDGTAVLARRQGAGRGRHGRRWLGLDGDNVFVSVIHRPHRAADLGQIAGLTLDVALAVHEALDAVGVKVGLDWPNDLVLDDRKIGGILCELHVDAEPLGHGHAVVIGVGLNVGARTIPAALTEVASSVLLGTGRLLDAAVLAELVVAAVVERMTAYGARGGPDIAAYRRQCTTVGARVRLPSGALGTAVDVASDGALIVLEDGDAAPQAVRAGVVTRVR